MWINSVYKDCRCIINDSVIMPDGDYAFEYKMQNEMNVTQTICDPQFHIATQKKKLTSVSETWLTCTCRST